MTEQESIERIIKRSSGIMVKYPSLFPIVDKIFIVSKNHYKIKENNLIPYVRHIIETQIGLYGLAHAKYAPLKSLQWTAEFNFFGVLEMEIVKNIILEYAESFPNKEQQAEYKKMLIDEEFTKPKQPTEKSSL